MTLSVIISMLIFGSIILVAKKLFQIVQLKLQYMKIILVVYGTLLIIATIYVGFMKGDVKVMTKSEKVNIVKQNEDFVTRAEHHQLKGKEEDFFVKSFKQNIEGNKLYITADTGNDNLIVYVQRIKNNNHIVEGEVYHSNAYHRSLNFNDEISYAKVDWQFPHTLRISKPAVLEKTYHVITDSTPLFSFNPGYFKGYSRSGYSSFLDGYTIINLKVPKQVKIKDINHLIWKAE
ncbi:hypothetical protein ACIQ4I_19505 [Rummeliibacillus sp. NPDC094406]|uniref:hypothetical protein n=1 Tax=Rummeliibacillus sp. NPDC094406 TaxID=3364511 RepID=UPI003825E483